MKATEAHFWQINVEKCISCTAAKSLLLYPSCIIFFCLNCLCYKEALTVLIDPLCVRGWMDGHGDCANVVPTDLSFVRSVQRRGIYIFDDPK